MIINITNGSLTSVAGTLSVYPWNFLPGVITVTGASSAYNSSTGAYTISSLFNTTVSLAATAPWAFNCSLSQFSGVMPLSGGTHTLQVRSRASGHVIGPASDTVIFEAPYDVSYTLTGCSVSATTPGESSTQIWPGTTLSVRVLAAQGYELPSSITVTGASYTYNQADGTLTLSNPSTAVSVTITCSVVVSGYQVNIDTPEGYALGGEFYDGTTTSSPYLGSGVGMYGCTSGYLRFVAGVSGEGESTALGVNSVSTGITYTDASNPTGYLFTVTADGSILMHDVEIMCFARGTSITLANGETKPVEDITYDDDLLVWDFDNGHFASAKPLWLKRVQTCSMVDCAKFSDGSIVQFVEDHRIFNVNAGKFTYLMTDETPLHMVTINDKGEYVLLIDKYQLPSDTEFYNIVTDYHMNVFAGHILTSCRLSNIYPIVNLKYVPDGRPQRDPAEFADLPQEYVSGLRLLEQPDLTPQAHDPCPCTLKHYVYRLICMAQPKLTEEGGN